MSHQEYEELVDKLTDLEIALTNHSLEMSPAQRVSGTWSDVISTLDELKYKIAEVQP